MMDDRIHDNNKLAIIAFILAMCFAGLVITLTIVATTSSGVKQTEVIGNQLYIEGHFGPYPIREFEYNGVKYIAFGRGNNFTVVQKNGCKCDK